MHTRVKMRDMIIFRHFTFMYRNYIAYTDTCFFHYTLKIKKIKCKQLNAWILLKRDKIENYSSTRLFFIVAEHKQQYKNYLASLATYLGLRQFLGS
jgi:hypothetical protein